MSNILPVNLEEHPVSGRGRYSTVGVLEPAIRIERSSDPDGDATSGDSDGITTGTSTTATSNPVYRIVITFVLELGIVGFDQVYDYFFFKCVFQPEYLHS